MKSMEKERDREKCRVMEGKGGRGRERMEKRGRKGWGLARCSMGSGVIDIPVLQQ